MGTYEKTHPQASLDDFYRDHRLDLYRAVKDIQAVEDEMPRVWTAEGHPNVLCKADFRIASDPLEVESALDETDEFIRVGEARDGEFAGCLHYIWLRAKRCLARAGVGVAGTRAKSTLTWNRLWRKWSWMRMKTTGIFQMSRTRKPNRCMNNALAVRFLRAKEGVYESGYCL